MIVYKIRNKVNGKVYVGITIRSVEARVRGHLRERKNPSLIQKALKKYGIQSFTVSVIDTADTRKVLCEKEIYWIKKLNCRPPHGYNLTAGGDGMLDPSASTRAKLSKIHKGRKRPDMVLILTGKPSRNKGKRASEATRKLISKLVSGKNNPNYGNRLSAAAKKRISVANTGRIRTKAQKQKMSERAKGKNNPRYGCKLSKEHKNVLSISSKAWAAKCKKLGLPIGRPKGTPFTEAQKQQHSIRTKAIWAQRKANGTDGWHGKPSHQRKK
jgi:group I intron endonuclease